MKKLLILSGAAALVFSSCGTKGGNLKDVTDTLAYTMGWELGEYVKNMDSVMEMKFDLATVVAAMKDVAKGRHFGDDPSAGHGLHSGVLTWDAQAAYRQRGQRGLPGSGREG